MGRYRVSKVDSEEVTPEPVYLNRRLFMKTVGAAGLAGLQAACGIRPAEETPVPPIDLTPEGEGDRLNRIGETNRRPTLMFNGYADEVASLYEGMDLKVNY